MHKVLYEITYRMDWKVLIPFAVLLGFLCFLIPKIRKIRREKSFKGHKADIFFCSIGVLVSLTVCGISVASQIDMYQNIVAAYEDGRYQTVEGYVEDFIPMPRRGMPTNPSRSTVYASTIPKTPPCRATTKQRETAVSYPAIGSI